jgi:hypothetical protein
MIKELLIIGIACSSVLIKSYTGINHIFTERNVSDELYDTAQQKSPKVLFNHHTHRDFIKGKLSDAGGNLYISKNGRLQFINLFDLNADGYPEVVTNNDHNGYDTPDALVYYNTQPNGLRSLNFAFAKDAPAFQNFSYTMESLSAITRLPASGGGKAVVEDINLDGYKDLVFTNIIHGSTLAEMPSYIYWGGADGLNPLRRSLLPADRGTAVAVDDITGDGLPDIIVANVGREHMFGETEDYSYQALSKRAGEREKTSYLFVQSDPGFAPGARKSIQTQYAVDVKTADFKNDGNKSIIFLELGEPGALRIIPTNKGELGKPQIIPVLAAKFSPSFGKRITPEILVKDLNADGYVDIFVPSTGKKSEIFWSNKGVFSQSNRTILGSENAFSADAADLNTDGFVDLVVASCYTVDDKANYNFETDSHIWWGSNQGFNDKQRQALPTKGAVCVKLADVNNTGLTDIVFAQHRDNQSTDIASCVYNNSSHGFSLENRTDLQSFGATSIVAEDIKGTGRKDVIVINSLSGIARHAGLNDGPGNEGVSAEGLPMYIYKGNAAGKYGPANLIRVPEASQETNIAFADMQDKGRADLVYLRGSGKRVAIRYNIYNYPDDKEIIEVDIPFRGNTVNVADFNSDGILDMLVTPVNGPQGALIFGLGERRYKVELFDFPYMAYAASIGDINNDGLLDAVTCGYNRVCIMLGDNKGGFHLQKPIIISSDIFTTRVSMADFNNDGWLDILCQNLQNFDSKVYDIESWVLISNKGSFSLSNKRSFHTYGANGGTIAQLYNDDKLQFIAANYHADESRRAATFVLNGDKDGYPVDENKIRLSSYSSGANLVMDFNADGYQDILVYNHTGSPVYDGSLNPTGGTHGVGSVIYWGANDGFSLKNTSNVQSFGPHSRIAADAGSISRRNSYEVYTSHYINNTLEGKKLRLVINGRFNNKQNVKPELLIGKTELTYSTIKPLLISQSASQIVYEVDLEKGSVFRYRLQLNSSNSGAGPVVSSVQMEEAN